MGGAYCPISLTCFCFFLFYTERIFVGRSHIARVAEARLEQINRYTQVSGGIGLFEEMVHVICASTDLAMRFGTHLYRLCFRLFL